MVHLEHRCPFDVIPRLRSGLLGSPLGVHVWVSWSSPKGQPEVRLDVEASLRSRSPKPQLGKQLEVTHSFHFRGSAPSILAVARFFHLEEERFLSNEAIIVFSIL